MTEADADGEEARTLRPLQAAAVTYRIAFGSRAGQKVLTLRGAMPREVTARQALCAEVDGFSLHAAVRVEAHERKRLERLCRYITRPALSDERIQVNAAGQVQLELKTPWRDGTTHLVMSPLEFMQRLAALVPRPRLRLIRYHGVLAPNAKLRARVVPQQPPALGHAATEVEARAKCEEVEPVRARSQRMGWARLLKRVFDIDMRRCPRCGGVQVKIIAAILERAVIGKILTHLGLDPQPPPRSKAREAGLEFAAWEAGAHAGTRPVACSGWRVAWGMLRAMCAQRARARRRARARGRNRTP
ncbi:MAG: transposase [Pseudomonadota bacterium]|uniref:transposase n=1 Tax=Silanimonas sp. TaxID=1929290 RepID=UPI0022BC3EE6|nr:transposase [Silanimonas sp.]MCZ8167094.1 transposase [Silanimonas sp.]